MSGRACDVLNRVRFLEVLGSLIFTPALRVEESPDGWGLLSGPFGFSPFFGPIGAVGAEGVSRDLVSVSKGKSGSGK